jgi:hypothetical protein
MVSAPNHKVRAEAHQLSWADTLMLVHESPPGWPYRLRHIHRQGAAAANVADAQLQSEGEPAATPQQDFSQICPTRNNSGLGDTVSPELAGGVSRSLIGEHNDQRRVERAVQ